MFHAAVPLNLTVAAVMVGKKQSLGGNDLTGASASEKYDSVLQRGLIHAVDVFGGEPEPFALHVPDALCDK